MCYLIVVLFFGTVWGQLAAPEPEWRIKLNTALELLEAGSTDAVGAFESAQRTAQSVADGGLAQAVVLSHFSALLIRLERYKEAEQTLQLALAAFDRNPGQAVAENVLSLNNMALVYRQTGQPAFESKYLTMAVQKAESIHPIEPMIFIPTIGNLAIFYMELGDYNRTKALLERAQAFEQHPSVAKSLLRLPLLVAASEVALQQGNYDVARDKATLALRIGENSRVGGEMDLVGALHQLARAEMELGHLRAAQIHWQRSVQIIEKHRSRNFPQLATMFLSLSSIAREQGKYDESKSLLQEATRVAEITQRMSVLAIIHHEKARLQMDRKRYAEAEALLRTSLDSTSKYRGKNNTEYASCLSDLALSLTAQRKYADADKMTLEAIATTEQIRAPTDPELLILLERHAELLGKLRRKDEARQVHARVQKMREAGFAHPANHTLDVLELKSKQ